MPIPTVETNCPRDPDEVAEAYCLGRLSRQESHAFETHYLVCPRCASVASETYDFIEAFRMTSQPQARGPKRPKRAISREFRTASTPHM